MKHIFLLSVFCIFVCSAGAKKQLVIGFGDTCPAGKVSVTRNYVEAVSAAGYVPLIIPMVDNQEQLKQLVKQVDIVFLTGGADVHPAYYHAECSPQLGEVVGRRDTFEMALLKEAVAQKKPIFGTCRGLQMINVFFCGTLYQDLPSERPSNITHRGISTSNVAHKINIEPDSRLCKVLGTTEMDANSSHHQAVKDLAPGFRISARAEDGVVEAIESDTYPAAAVQFHPEALVKKAVPAYRKLYESLLKLVKN